MYALVKSAPISWFDFLAYELDFMADEYDKWGHSIHSRLADQVSEMAQVEKGQTVIEFGIRTGHTLESLAKDAGRENVFGLEISPRMLQIATKRLQGRQNLIKSTIEHHYFQPQTADLVVMNGQINYCLDLDWTRAELFSLIKPGGYLILAVRRRSLDQELQNYFFERLRIMSQNIPWSIPQLSQDYRNKLGEPDFLVPWLENAGFKIDRITTAMTGGIANDGLDFCDLLSSAGPWPHMILETLGPAYKSMLARQIELRANSGDGLRYHHAYTLVKCKKPRLPK